MNTTALILPVGIMTFVLVLLLVSACLIPRLTRPELYFAVTVPSAFRDSEEGRTILGKYRTNVIIFSLVSIAVLLSGLWMPVAGYIAVVSVVSICLQSLGVYLAYYVARRRVLPHAVAPTTMREAALAPHEVRLPGGWLAQLGPFGLLLAAAIWLGAHWEGIPPRFPIHWGIDGRPNGWATRTFGGVFAPVLIGGILSALMAALAYSLLRWSRPIRVGGTSGQNEQRFRHLVGSVLVAIEYFLAIEFTWAGLLPLSAEAAGPPGMVPFLVFSLIFTVGILALLIRFGQGGTRLPEGAAIPAKQQASPIGDRTEDRYWKLGLFYFNTDDPALFVEKRFGIGYTLNFGHAGAWLFVGALVAILVLIIILVPKHS